MTAATLAALSPAMAWANPPSGHHAPRGHAYGHDSTAAGSSASEAGDHGQPDTAGPPTPAATVPEDAGPARAPALPAPHAQGHGLHPDAAAAIAPGQTVRSKVHAGKVQDREKRSFFRPPPGHQRGGRKPLVAAAGKPLVAAAGQPPSVALVGAAMVGAATVVAAEAPYVGTDGARTHVLHAATGPSGSSALPPPLIAEPPVRGEPPPVATPPFLASTRGNLILSGVVVLLAAAVIAAVRVATRRNGPRR